MFLGIRLSYPNPEVFVDHTLLKTKHFRDFKAKKGDLIKDSYSHDINGCYNGTYWLVW